MEVTTENINLIELNGVSKIFGDKKSGFCALNKIYLNIQNGDFIAIQGPSGCGKSTLLSILGLLDTATKGQYMLCGQRVDHLTKYQQAILRNKHIGWIFQNFNLIGDLTVEENVKLPLKYHGSIGKSDYVNLVKEALEKVGLEDKLNSYPTELSGGQQQRVAIARAIVTKPDIIIADEPTGNLDSKSAESVFNLLESLNNAGSTVLIVTHDSYMAKKCKRIINMKDGRLVDMGLSRIHMND